MHILSIHQYCTFGFYQYNLVHCYIPIYCYTLVHWYWYTYIRSEQKTIWSLYQKCHRESIMEHQNNLAFPAWYNHSGPFQVQHHIHLKGKVAGKMEEAVPLCYISENTCVDKPTTMPLIPSAPPPMTFLREVGHSWLATSNVPGSVAALTWFRN